MTVSRAVTASVLPNASLPQTWTVWLGIGADQKTPRGVANLCGPAPLQCDAESGPYPGVRRGLGKGWAAAESAEVWLCRSIAPCVGRTDPVATININWTLP